MIFFKKIKVSVIYFNSSTPEDAFLRPAADNIGKH